jgi:Reverse transcriptase (RNA-dependent DNA polymerase)
LDIKGAFDHVSTNQLLGFCQRLKLPIFICKWIKSFINNRYIQLAFDGEKSEKTAINTGISQESPVSSILFLIYIRFLFEETKDIKISIPSYLDDIAILVKSESLEKNCQTLENIAKKLIYWGQANQIEFDREKTDIIHFYWDKTDISELTV